jgi:nitrogenase subunit NifH
MREYFGDLVFDTVIHRNVRLAEAPSAGQPVLAYDPESKGAVEYKALAEEIINDRTAEPSPVLSAPAFAGVNLSPRKRGAETGVGAALVQETNNGRG